MPQLTLDGDYDIILRKKEPDGTTKDLYLWTAEKGEILKLNPKPGRS